MTDETTKPENDSRVVVESLHIFCGDFDLVLNTAQIHALVKVARQEKVSGRSARALTRLDLAERKTEGGPFEITTRGVRVISTLKRFMVGQILKHDGENIWSRDET